MIFNSYIFLFAFFPVTLGIFWLLKNKNHRYVWLTMSGYLFYGYWNWRFLILMFATTTLDYLIARKINTVRADKTRTRRYLALSIVANLGALGFFKYANFATQSIADLVGFFGHHGSIPLLHIVVPISISFYTFQAISYTIDVYRGKAEVITNFFEYSTYIALFPHLIAGPIVRYVHIAPDLKTVDKPPRSEFFFRGINFFVIGLTKKVIIADSIASIIDPIFQHYTSFTMAGAWLVAFGYAYQLYFDFSGYSDMAVGLASCLGFRFPQNFNSPYTSKTITEFWQRWHITLSTWLHDYLFVPLVFRFSRKSTMSKLKIYSSLIITMFLAGLWHGASWVTIIWGVMHGILLVFDKIFQKSYQKLGGFTQRIFTFFILVLTFGFFRTENFAVARVWFKSLFTLHKDTLPQNSFRLIILIIIATVITQFFPNTFEIKYVPKVRYALLLAFAFTTCVILINYRHNIFIYYQF